MSLRWGLLSTARINDALIAGVRESGRDELLAVASRDAQRAEDYARARDIPRGYAGYEAMLADPDLDAVYISLPNSEHLPWTERALRAGKHVLCEKPMGRDPEAVEAVFELAAQRGLVLAEAFMYRHNPQTLRLAELVGEGAIGPLRAVRAEFSFLLSDPGDVRLQSSLDGGALMDLGCYCVSAARLLAGEPEAVAGVQVIGGDAVDLSFAGALRFGAGVVADLHCSFAAAASSGLALIGETGTIAVGDPWHVRTPGISVVDAQGVREVSVPVANSYALEADDFAAAVAGDVEPRLGRDDAVGQAATLQALYAAAAAVTSD